MHRWFLTFPLNVIKGHRVSFCNYICYGKLTKNQYFNSIPLQFHVKLSNRLASDRCRLPVNPITQCIFATTVLIPREIKNKMQNFMAKPICIVACTQTLIADIYFPAFLYLSLALGGLLWENRGSVNRLIASQNMIVANKRRSAFTSQTRKSLKCNLVPLKQTKTSLKDRKYLKNNLQNPSEKAAAVK